MIGKERRGEAKKGKERKKLGEKLCSWRIDINFADEAGVLRKGAEIIPCEPDADNADEGSLYVKEINFNIVNRRV